MRGRYALMLLTPPGLPVVRSYLTRQGTGGREGLRRGTDNGAIEKIPGTGTLRYSGTQQHHVARGCYRERHSLPPRLVNVLRDKPGRRGELDRADQPPD